MVSVPSAPSAQEERSMTKTRYPRSSARPIYLTVAFLGVLGLAGIIVMLIAMADVPRQSYYLLITAFGLLIIALTGALAVLLATNTRRPWGIDPNLGAPSVALLDEPSNAGAEADDEQMRHAVQLPDGNGYGRRRRDDPEVVRRMISKLEQEEDVIPLSRSRPEWATEMLPPQYLQEVAHEQTEQPDPPMREVPIDQLDLLPATPDDSNSNSARANGGL